MAVKLVADIAVVADGHVLLVRYEDVSRDNGQRGWFLPDDYLADGEHPDAAARRILREQAGLEFGPTLAEIESLANGNLAPDLSLPNRCRSDGGGSSRSERRG